MIRDGDFIVISRITFDQTVISEFARRFLPAAVQVPIQSIEIATTAADDRGDLDSFLSIAENKFFDIYLFMLLRDGPGRAMFQVYPGVPAGADYDAVNRSSYYYKVVGAILMSIILHGSAQELYRRTPQVAKLLSKALGMAPAEFSMNLLCSIPNFSRVKMPELIDSVPVFGPHFQDEVKSRMRLGVAGNRIWPFLKWLKEKLSNIATLPDVVQYMLEDNVLDAAPYISCHPMHSLNPFRNASRHLRAYFGDLMRRQQIPLPEAQGGTADYLKGWFLDPFRQDIAFTAGHLPNLDDMILATHPGLSMAAALP
jgi:hypothetical protein